MAEIILKRPVMVKVIMTDDFRRQLIGEAQETMKRITDNLNAMEASTGTITKPGDEAEKMHLEQWKMHLQVEKERLSRMKQELDWRIRELENVQNGAELPYRVLEGSTTVKVGDNFLEKMSQTEVVIKDWNVMEIRGA